MPALTFPAAPTPPGVRRAAAASTAIGVVGIGWGAVTVAGTGTGGLLASLVVAVALPVAWVAAMHPRAYSLEDATIRVHRRLLPDSVFPVSDVPERLAVAEMRTAAEARTAAASGTGSGRPRGTPAAGRDAVALLERRRVLRAVTDVRRGVRVPIARGGTLVISPADPDAFIRAAGGLRE